MFELQPMTERVIRKRNQYRNTVPKLCTARIRIVTEFYQNNPHLTGILRRARMFKHLCENIPVSIFDDELIVGSQVTTYRGSPLNPEFGGISWFRSSWEAGTLLNRPHDNYLIDPEDIDYVLSIVDYWEEHNNSAALSAYLPEGYEKMSGNGVAQFTGNRICQNPIGHFCANYKKVLCRGFRSLWEEARENIRRLEGHLYGDDVDKYNFYRSVSIVLEGMITLIKRYSLECANLAEKEKNELRTAELQQMAECLMHISENPCRGFHDAVQCIYMYHIGMCLDGQQHGISFGRVDQNLGEYYRKDIEEGRITPERAQEILDLFYLKCAEMNKMTAVTNSSATGYTSGMLMTMGGVDENGEDATNDVTYMMLQSAARLVLHDPPQALRVHKNTPAQLWEAALKTTMRAGGVPTFENDEVIIPALMKKGMDIKSARDYCLIGCVEPSGSGNHWSMCGATGKEGYWNMANCFLQAINNGINPFPNPDGTKNSKQSGVATGYLYEMASFDDVLNAVKRQMQYFVDWQITLMNTQEYVTSKNLPLPLVSATIDGCMESGKDVMDGGARFNSSGFPGIAIGNLVDCLALTKYLVYDKKICSSRELYDALMANWEGYEELHSIIMHKVPRYGNGDQYCDGFLRWISSNFSEMVHRGINRRGGKFFAGLFPVAFNVMYGLTTAATPDGRYLGQPLSDGISPMQGIDRSGPATLMGSILGNLDQTDFPDGTLMNLKFTPTVLSNDSGMQKVMQLMRTYFANGGMELQLNFVDGEMLKKAQLYPAEYKDLVVRVAGFSAYFVELTKGSQEDVIKRSELVV